MIRLAARLLTGTALVCGATVDTLAEQVLGVKCPICRERTKCPAAHINVNHAEHWR